MRKYAAGRTARSAAVFVLMLLLFPYIVSVFVNGAGADEKPFHGRSIWRGSWRWKCRRAVSLKRRKRSPS